MDYRARVASNGRPYRTYVVEGFEVFVGKGEDDNDYLTFDVAEPHDLWLHVGGGTPGSHVVVRSRGEDVSPTVIIRAASLAAWYSKARDEKLVDVHWCKASDVSKPRGAKAGLVELARFKNVKVAPRG